MHEFIPKDLRNVGKVYKSPKTKKQVENKRRRQRDVRVNKANREMADRDKAEKRWSNFVPFDQQLATEVSWAKGILEGFMRESGKIVEINRIHYFYSRHDRSVKRAVEECTNKPWGWLILKQGKGRRPGLNKTELRKICVLLQVKYWDMMSTNEMRAVLILLAVKDGIDARRDL